MIADSEVTFIFYFLFNRLTYFLFNRLTYIQADAKFNRCREVTTEAVSESSKHKPDAQRARKEPLFIGRHKSVSQFLYFAWKQ